MTNSQCGQSAEFQYNFDPGTMARLHTSSPNRQKHRPVQPKSCSLRYIVLLLSAHSNGTYTAYKPWDVTSARYKNPRDLTRRAAPNIRSRVPDTPSPSPRYKKAPQVPLDYQFFGLDDETFYDDERPDDKDEGDRESHSENDNDNSFHWEDENTLFSDLLEEKYVLAAIIIFSCV